MSTGEDEVAQDWPMRQPTACQNPWRRDVSGDCGAGRAGEPEECRGWAKMVEASVTRRVTTSEKRAMMLTVSLMCYAVQ